MEGGSASGHLLVPLDGSKPAEAVLPAAAHLASSLGARVTLFHVLERDAPARVHGERHLDEESAAGSYLQEIAGRVFGPDVRVDCHVHTPPTGDVARSLVEHARELGVGLIAMSTHGRGGLRGFFYGTIAQQVVATGVTPVLLVRTSADGSCPRSFRLALVPDDATADHEPGLEPFVALARVWGSAVLLLHVVPTPGKLSGAATVTGGMLPGATRMLLEMSIEEAAVHLHEHVTTLAGLGIEATYEIKRGDPARVILSAVASLGADLIVLRTHGRAGTAAFWEASLGDRLARSSTASLLMLPLRKPAP